VITAFGISMPGCGGTAIDDAKTADTIQHYLETSLHEKVRSVDCPSDQPIDPKSTFDCEVELAGGKQMLATVEIRNEDADFGIVDYKPKKQE
jgi:hypothetical protein